MIKPDWIALDWGTTNLRAFAMTKEGRVVARASSDAGMGSLAPDGFEGALLDLIADWLDDRRMPILAAGMVGARQGWVEASYLSAPTPPLATASLATPSTADARLDVHIIPGVSQARPADVMRGEETQIAGYLRHDPDFDGVLCLPGTHSKWARISAGEIVGFRTFMTGEMFTALSQYTILRHGLGTGWDDEAFITAVQDGLSHPEMIGARLFAIRAEGLLDGLLPDMAHARLSGLLIGVELAASRTWWLGQNVALIGAEPLSLHYQKALHQQGVIAPVASAEDMSLSGLTAAHAQMKGTS
ncbi:MAG: 2-dehydro-3-deoxygalactonokinase [Pseudomonadota bacterium]